MSTRWWLGPVLAMASVWCCAAKADAPPSFQGYVEMPQVLAPTVMGNMATENLRLLNAQSAKGDSGRVSGLTRPESTVARGSSASSTPRQLAARYPAAQRPQIEHAFRESLSGYRQLEDKLGIPRDDVAGAVAAFLAGNYMAYRDVTVPDEDFKQLVEQMRSVLAANTVFQAAPGAQKREMYEQLAIVGTFMAVARESLKRQPAQARYAQNLKQSAKANLEQFLKTDANRIEITAKGLVLH